jgi:restriction endonuclease S subunit
MIICSIIQKSQLEGATRLDAEYYQPEYLEIEERIKKLKTFVLGEISFITDGQHGYFKLDENSEIRQITAQHIIDGFIDKTNADRLSKETHEKNLRASLKENDIVLSTVGTVGNAGVVTKEILPANLDQNVARINLNIKDLDPWYLVVFLNSKYGQLQINRNITGQVQQRLSLETLRHLEIPIISEQEHVGNLLKNSYKALTLSKSLYSQAEDLLLGELGLKNFKMEEELSYIVNLSDVKSAHRADAEYFQPKYKKIEEKLVKTFNAKKIKDLDFIKVTTGQYSEEYTSEKNGMPYIRGTNLMQGTVNLDNIVYIDPQRQIPQKKAKEGDVVVTRVGTIGISARLPKEIEGGTISDNLIRLRFEEKALNSYYVSLFFNTIGSQLMIRESRGSVQARLNQETLKEIILPILPKSIQQKAADLVHQSHQARKKSKELLERAKREVEEFIEGK